MGFSVIKADSKHLLLVSELFDAYRVFYEQDSDLQQSRAFLERRFQNNDSVVFLALDGEIPVGFTQLYKTFSSVSLQPFYILNDLYVKPEYRGQRAGKLLLKRAQEFCSDLKFKGLALETAKDNPAQKLYEQLGWEKDEDFFHYFWKNTEL